MNYESADAYGHVKANVYVNAVNLFGRTVTRKVSLGSRSATIEEARQIAETVRTNNSGKDIQVMYTLSL